ncbi:hypothetical protein BYT27DRAFT_7217437 [Phlegmacium glaucopus]|nr:hypothetical protein BYT27DRAFT_7217437 [Phlegmacium glaucopus]
MSVQSTPPIPSMSAPAANDKVALPPLELTEAEMHICQQWLGEYAKLDSKTDHQDAWRVRKSQVNCWFQNHCCKSSIATCLSLTQNISLRQVVCHIYKAEIQTIVAKRVDGAEPGSQQYIQGFQGAVNEFMERLEPEKYWNWSSFLERLAGVQYREMGMQSIIWEFHETRAGMKIFQLHNFNENLGKVKVQPFEVKFPEAVEQFEVGTSMVMTSK